MRKSTLVPLTLEGISAFIQKQDKRLRKNNDERLAFHRWFIQQHLEIRSLKVRRIVLIAYAQSGIIPPWAFLIAYLLQGEMEIGK